MKLNEPGRQKLERQNFCQWVKHAKLYLGLFQVSKKKKNVPLVESVYPTVFTRMPGGVTTGDSDLCCCVPCLLSTINSSCLLSSPPLPEKKEGGGNSLIGLLTQQKGH